ncbi:MAG: DUF6690 family protein [Pirellulaceae bacterium]
MFSKRARFLTMLAASAGIPYAWFNENLAGPIRATWKSLSAELTARSESTTHFGDILPALPAAYEPQPTSSFDVSSRPPEAPSNHTVSSVAPALRAGRSETSGAGLFCPLPETLRFDIDPRWVTDRWPRVSTVHAQPDLEGLRVPLVSGTGPADILGSLTYYFDRRQRVCRLTLQGQTGDERALVHLASQRFGVKPEATLSAGIYVARWNGQPINVLHVSRAPVIRASSPHTRLRIELEVNDPSAGHGLSSELRQMLQYESQVRRWGD